MRRMASGRAVTRLLLPLLVLAGCHEDITQVVLVVQSDLSVPSDVDGMDVSTIEGSFAPPVVPFFNQFGRTLPLFPLSLALASLQAAEPLPPDAPCSLPSPVAAGRRRSTRPR